MIAYIWPVALIVFSTVMYQICAKSVPESLDPLASMTVTYMMAACVSAVLYFLLGGRNLLQEYHKLNWAPFVLGIVILGLEAGSIYAYKAGWEVSTKYLVECFFIAAALIVVGFLLYNESLSWNKLLGIVICLAGLMLINRK